jgi:hypothetical protein
MGVESMPFLRIVRAIYAVRIELARLNASNPDVPYIPGAMVVGVQLDGSRGSAILRMVKEIEPDAGRMTAEKHEIGAVALLVGAQGQRGSRPYPAILRDIAHIVRERSMGHCATMLAHIALEIKVGGLQKGNRSDAWRVFTQRH